MENEQQSQRSPQLRQDEQPSYKNELQIYAQRAGLDLPVYYTKNTGLQHASQFKCSVTVDDETYESPSTFAKKKAAEQDAAKCALEGIANKRLEKGSSIISMNTTFCKALLNEFAAKLQVERPKYNTVQMQRVPVSVFVSTLEFRGASYTGGPAKTKRDAEQLVAYDVIISILGNSKVGTTLLEILKSKAKFLSSTQLSKDPSGCTIGLEEGSNSGGDGASSRQFKDVLIPISSEEQFKDASKSCALQTEGAPVPHSIKNLVTPPMETFVSGGCNVTAASQADGSTFPMPPSSQNPSTPPMQAFASGGCNVTAASQADGSVFPLPQSSQNPVTPPVKAFAGGGHNVTSASQAVGSVFPVPLSSQNPSTPPMQAFTSGGCNVTAASEADGSVFPVPPSSQNPSTPLMEAFAASNCNITSAPQADASSSLVPSLSQNPSAAPVQVSTNDGCKIIPATQAHRLVFNMAPQNQSREIMYVPQVGLQSYYPGCKVASAPQAGGPLGHMPQAPELLVAALSSIQDGSVAHSPQSTKRSNRSKRYKANKKARKANQMGGPLCSALSH